MNLEGVPSVRGVGKDAGMTGVWVRGVGVKIRIHASVQSCKSKFIDDIIVVSTIDLLYQINSLLVVNTSRRSYLVKEVGGLKES
jgi:hypothetical protein